MIDNIFELFFFPLMCGVFGYTVATILTAPDMILYPIWVLLNDKLKWSPWITKPTLGCAYCISGQVALWLYPFIFDYNVINHIWIAIFDHNAINHIWTVIFDYSVINHIWTVIFAIFSIEIYNKLFANA